MKKILSFFILSSAVFNITSEQDPIFKRSFFSTVPNFRPASPEIVSMIRDRLEFCCDNKQRLNFFVLGGKSLNESKLGSYFTPNSSSQDSFSVGELGSDLVKNNKNNVVANYFNILTAPLFTGGSPASFADYTFESNVTFKPTQEYLAFAFNYFRHLSKTQDCGWWIDVWLPFKWVRNNMNMCEEVVQKGGPGGDDPQVPSGFAANMTQAMKQPIFQFGKIDGAQSAVGIADVFLRIGNTFYKNETRHFAGYYGAILPTSNKATAEYLFEPIYGNGGHAGIFSGAEIGFRMWHDCTKSIYWELDTAGTLLFKNTQMRSLDLKDKTWGRYMWVYLSPSATYTTPGINVFTRSVEVSPGTQRDLNLAFTLEHSKYRVEAGYHYFGRSAEKIEICQFPANRAIATIVNSAGDFVGTGDDKTSRNRSTIQDYLGVLNDTTASGTDIYVPVGINDLDLESGAHPSTVTHGFYVAASFHWLCYQRPTYFGIGFMYENGSDNTTMDKWGIFSKLGIEF